MNVELLVITKQDGEFCSSKNSFNNLLKVNDQISLSGSKLKFTKDNETLEVSYSIETKLLAEKQQRYFHIILGCEDDDKIVPFSNLVRLIRKIVIKIGDDTVVNTLVDDISKSYIIKAYPLINEIENLMRNLIIKFMIVNVGMGWFDEVMPEDLRKKISGKAEQSGVAKRFEDTLHNADFGQLSEFLFGKYRNKNIEDLERLISSSKPDDTILFEELKKYYYASSNWDRYFRNLINYDGEKLALDWEKLNKLRIKIAHNKSFSKSDLDSVDTLVSKVKDKLSAAIENLKIVELDEEQKHVIFSIYANHNATESSSDIIKSYGLSWAKENLNLKILNEEATQPYSSPYNAIELSNNKSVGVIIRDGDGVWFKEWLKFIKHGGSNRVFGRSMNMMIEAVKGKYERVYLLVVCNEFSNFKNAKELQEEILKDISIHVSNIALEIVFTGIMYTYK